VARPRLLSCRPGRYPRARAGQRVPRPSGAPTTTIRADAASLHASLTICPICSPAHGGGCARRAVTGNEARGAGASASLLAWVFALAAQQVARAVGDAAPAGHVQTVQMVLIRPVRGRVLEDFILQLDTCARPRATGHEQQPRRRVAVASRHPAPIPWRARRRHDPVVRPRSFRSERSGLRLRRPPGRSRAWPSRRGTDGRRGGEHYATSDVGMRM